jgi:hypothetical protein
MRAIRNGAAIAFAFALSACQATTPIPIGPSSTPTPSARPSPLAEDGPLLAAATLRRSHDFDGRVALFLPLVGGELSEFRTWEFSVSGPEDTEGAYATLMRRPQSNDLLVNVRGFRTWLWSPPAKPVEVLLPDPLQSSTDLRWSPDGQWVAGRSNSGDRIAVWNPTTDQRLDFDGQFGDVAGWTKDGSALVLTTSAAPDSCFQSPSLDSLSLTGGSVMPYDPAGGGGAVGLARTQTGTAEISLATADAVTIEDDGTVAVIGACSGDGPARTFDLPEQARASDLEWTADGQSLYVLGAIEGQSHLWTYGSDYQLLADNMLRVEVERLAGISGDGRWLVALEPSTRPAPCAAQVFDLVTKVSWSVNPCSIGQEGPGEFLYPDFAWLDPGDLP